MQHRTFSEFVAATLADRAPFLAQRWLERSQAATPRRQSALSTEPVATADTVAPESVTAQAERVVRALGRDVLGSVAATQLLVADGVVGADAPSLLGALADVPQRPLGKDASATGEVMRLGWSAGAHAFATELSIQHVVRDAELLLSIVLADLERITADAEAHGTAQPSYGAMEAIAVTRRLHRATARYTQAAVSGFVHALLHALRERYRMLRHDLRNPLSTIRSALSLMEDESVPAETRNGPGIRAMVARNAGSLDRLISRGLDDRAAAALLAPPQEIALRDVALAARREVREVARLAGAEIVVVDGTASLSRVDPAACELTLTALLLAGLAGAPVGSTLRIDGLSADPASTGALVLEIRVIPGADDEDDRPADCGWWELAGLELAASLAGDHGGQLTHRPPLAGDTADAARYQPAPDVATLARHATLYLYLPLTRADDAVAVGTPSAQRSADRTPVDTQSAEPPARAASGAVGGAALGGR